MPTPATPTARKVTFTGPVKVVEMTGAWGVYAGERIVLGAGQSFHDDLGLRMREAFQPGAAEAIKNGDPLPEAFDVGQVRITIELLGD
jgi:hypothetical protein